MGSKEKIKKNNSMETEIDDETLCAEYAAVFRYMLALTRNEHEAEDITQETFLRALDARESFSGGSSLYTWLCSIARNIMLNRLKKQKRSAGSEPLEYLTDDDIPIEQRAADRDSAMEIMRALHQLDEPYKEVFSLRVFGQLDFKQLGSIFGRTDSWARVTYYRAKEKIKEILRKDGTL